MPNTKQGKGAKTAEVGSGPVVSEPVTSDPKANATPFPIVGIGASAGGLEAFEHLLRGLPTDNGMAFVLVQHLDPAHASILTEILQRSTSMKVVEAEDGMAVMPNCVYVIPPNRHLAIFHGALQLSVPDQPRGHRMPIDSFLRSLAEDRGSHAIGVILSGTGSDGTLGLRAILGAGGLTFVQEPGSAKYEGMPSSAIKAGFASHVLPVDQLPAALVESAKKLPVGRDTRADLDPGLSRILMLVRSITGHDFSLYKKSTIGRRIERRMSQHNVTDAALYARFIGEHPEEAHALFEELLINVTSFFRDPEAFATLKREVLPELFAALPENGTFRVWVPACASGEEAYSLAILLSEYMEETGKVFRLQIYGTDIDEHAISLARAGRYPLNIVQDVDPARLRRYFNKDDAGYQVKKEIRESVVFAVQSVIKDPPFSKLDLLSCRNLMIYLKPELQDRLIATFHFALKPQGALFLSSSENIGSHLDRFTLISRKWRIYLRKGVSPAMAHVTTDLATTPARASGAPSAAVAAGGAPGAVPAATASGLASLTDRLLVQLFAPASLVTDLHGNILYVHGELGQYLRPAPGQATLNVVDMAHEALHLELRAAIRNAAGRAVPTLDHEVASAGDGGFPAVRLSVRPLNHPDSGEGLLLISFQPMPQEPASKRSRGRAAGSPAALQIAELERALSQVRESLQTTLEEQDTSSEELKSTNEEMQSTNEELQSTNEELETSKEEQQSINEELVTVNGELQSKIEQLASSQSDMKNLLDSINIATIFLDKDLAVRRFTRDAVQLYHLVPSDVGRPLEAIKSLVVAEALTADAREVLEKLLPIEHEVCTTAGRWYLARTQPYRTLDEAMDGVVLTFVDITDMKRAQEDLRLARELAEGVVDTVREPLVVLDAEFHVVSASRAFYRIFRTGPEATLGRPLAEVGNRRWNIPALNELLGKVLASDREFEGFVVELDLPTLGRTAVTLGGRRLVGKLGRIEMILLVMDIPGAAASEDQ